MKQSFLLTALIIFMTFSLTSCEAIGDIFKTGVWTGVILVVLVIAAIVFIIARMGKKG